MSPSNAKGCDELHLLLELPLGEWRSFVKELREREKIAFAEMRSLTSPLKVRNRLRKIMIFFGFILGQRLLINRH